MDPRQQTEDAGENRLPFYGRNSDKRLVSDSFGVRMAAGYMEVRAWETNWLQK